MDTQNDDISPLVRKWMPHASEEELREATFNFREFIGVIYGIYLRTRTEEGAEEALRRDKTGPIGKMD